MQPYRRKKSRHVLPRFRKSLKWSWIRYSEKRSFRHGARRTILDNANRVLEGSTELDFGHSDCVFYNVPDSSDDKNYNRLKKMLLKVYYE